MCSSRQTGLPKSWITRQRSTIRPRRPAARCACTPSTLLRSVLKAVEHAAYSHEPARWQFSIGGDDYLAESDGHRWTITANAPPAPADVKVTATTKSLAALVFAGSDNDIEISGDARQVERFRRVIGAMSDVVSSQAHSQDPAKP